MTIDVLIENQEKQIHNDRYHGQKLVTTYHRVKVHTNEAPPIQEVTKNLVRQEISNLSYKGEIVRLNLDEINLMQCRIVDKDPTNVAEILNFLQEEGYDPTQLPPAVVRFRGEYYLINGHHQYDALSQRGQTIWIFDVYEWNGKDDFDVFKSFLKGLGRKINLTGAPPKKDQTPKDLSEGYIKEIQENKERTGIAFLEYDNNGVPIPLDKASVERVLERDGFTSRWSPDHSSGKKSVYTKNLKRIQNWESHTTVSNIRAFDDARKKRIIKAGKFTDNGKKTADGFKGYIVCTDNPNSDGIKGFTQLIGIKEPVRFLSYSKETDNAENIIKNEAAYLQKAYDLYKESIAFHNKLVLKCEKEERHQTKVIPYTKDQFLSSFEWWAVSQLDDEDGDVTQR
jgi:hypothetical protein